MARGWIKDEALRADKILQVMKTKPDQFWTSYALAKEVGLDPKTAERILSESLLPAGRVEVEWGPQGALWRLVPRC